MKKKLIDRVILNGTSKTGKFEYRKNGNKIEKRALNPLSSPHYKWTVVKAIKEQS